MRIHRLEVTAFGPFAAPAAVDFDALSEAGLFLLTGATGAGKTSILDAVCFALYGAVPGDRQAGKRLRSDHADDGIAPQVSLELTVADRRLLINRSPSWSRSKKRGTGTTTEQARVVVSERVDGDWRPLTTRLDEAGHLVSGLLGMTVSQFCQVQLLPQGRFQAFLRAGSDERHRLLQQLFHTTRFEDVEHWLRDRRRALRRESARHHDRTASIVSRISEVSGQPLPESWDPHDLTAMVDELEPWCVAEVRRHAQESDELAREVSEAEAAESEARDAWETGRDRAARLDRLHRARSEHASLLARQPEHREQLARHDAARRAAAVVPVCDEWHRAEAEHLAAAAAAEASHAAVMRLLELPAVTTDQLAGVERDAVDHAARAGVLLPRVEERDEAETRLRELQRERDGVKEELAQLDQRAEQLPQRIASHRETLTRTRRAADGLAAARREAELAAGRLLAARQLVELNAELQAAEERHLGSVERTQALREAWLDLREQRLSGMAAEIACDLAVGASCPVCGSADHPHPAQAAPDAPNATAEREARRALDDAEAERLARRESLTDLETRIERARERSGDGPVADLEHEAAGHNALVEQMAVRAGGLEQAAAQVAEAERQQVDLQRRREALLTAQAGVDASLADHRQRVVAINAEVAAVLDDTGCDTVPALVDHLTAVADLAAAALRADRDAARTREVSHEAGERARAAARRQGFDDLQKVGQSALSEADLTALDEQVRRHEVRVAAVDDALADPQLAGLTDAAAPDVPALETAHRRSRERLADARARQAVAVGRDARLQRLGTDLAAALAGWRPVSQQLEVADGLATLTDGSSSDNRLRMRLSGYVLVFRLHQVVAAANERLVTMTDHRYRLEHSGDRGAGETRGGLSLRIRDDWSGETRDPVTLSGGETFVVSLALALGLADVIAHEAGGADLDTLFVDEGFGALDAETLDDVMDTLDSLRDGGRVVGVVSHVPEMRTRIPTQLQVRKHPSGSTVRQDAVNGASVPPG